MLEGMVDMHAFETPSGRPHSPAPPRKTFIDYFAANAVASTRHEVAVAPRMRLRPRLDFALDEFLGTGPRRYCASGWPPCAPQSGRPSTEFARRE